MLGVTLLLLAGTFVGGKTHRVQFDCVGRGQDSSGEVEAADCNYRVVAGNPFLSGPGPDFLEGTLLLGGGIGVTAVATFGAKKAT